MKYKKNIVARNGHRCLTEPFFYNPVKFLVNKPNKYTTLLKLLKSANTTEYR